MFSPLPPSSFFNVEEKELVTTPLRTPRIASTPKENGENHMCVCALIENSSREVGFSVMNMFPPSLMMYQFTDTALYSHTTSLLEVHKPVKILVPTNTAKSALSQMMISQYQNKVVEAPRQRFSDVTGLDLLKVYASSFDDERLENRYLAISASSALVCYVQSEMDFEVHEHSLNVEFKPLEGHLLLDPRILSHMNVLSVNVSESDHIRITTPKRKLCLPTLFHLVECCYTPSGARFMRATLASPPADVNEINLRQEFVEQLVTNDVIYESMKMIFQKVTDLDPAIAFLATKGVTGCSRGSLALDCMQRLLRCVDLMETLQTTLNDIGCDLATTLCSKIHMADVRRIGDVIHEFLNDDGVELPPEKSNSLIHVIKKGVSSVLDITRQTYENTVAEIYQHAKDLSDKYDVKIHVKFNKSRRYFLSINKSQLKKKGSSMNIQDAVENISCTDSGYIVPSELLHLVEHQNCISATTYRLLLLNKQNESAEIDTILTANKFLEAKIEEIKSSISSIYKMSETIAFIDALLSFATISRSYDGYNKPIVSSTRAIVLKQARHPLMEKMITSQYAQKLSKIMQPEQSTTFVPNDLTLTDAKPMMILRGVNMSGKTTLLQTVIHICILAQCGCYVPCQSASVFPFTHMFMRAGSEESLAGNASAFAVEMREMNQITTHSNATTLVAIDEPCVSTSVPDGIGISFSCLESLIAKRSFVVCATHYSELEILGSLYSSVVVREMGSKEKLDSSGFEFSYQIGEECNPPPGYGIKIASEFLPPELIDAATSIHKVLSQVKKVPKSKRLAGLQATSAIVQRLLTLKTSSLNDQALCNSLELIRQRCTVKSGAQEEQTHEST